MSNQFQGRKLLVVGGTSGMGLQVARQVMEQGGSAVIATRQRKPRRRAAGWPGWARWRH
jgi:NAD(P)-dependent dehydrogenase (short-subunit alcohol dehydrogenase family)